MGQRSRHHAAEVRPHTLTHTHTHTHTQPHSLMHVHVRTCIYTAKWSQTLTCSQIDYFATVFDEHHTPSPPPPRHDSVLQAAMSSLGAAGGKTERDINRLMREHTLERERCEEGWCGGEFTLLCCCTHNSSLEGAMKLKLAPFCSS